MKPATAAPTVFSMMVIIKTGNSHFRIKVKELMMVLKANNRIVNYLLKSDFKTPVTYGYGGGELQGVPAIYKRKVGVITQHTFVSASLISKLIV